MSFNRVGVGIMGLGRAPSQALPWVLRYFWFAWLGRFLIGFNEPPVVPRARPAH